MAHSTYTLSFTAGGVLKHESISLAKLYIELRDWNAVREQAINRNILQTRTISSLKRLYRELSFRLQTLTEEQMLLLANGTYQEQNNMLWLGICKRYEYIRDFVLEVINEKYKALDYSLTPYDYDSFFHAKSEWHSELDGLSDSTQDKLKQVLFRILREAEIITKDGQINQQSLSPQTIRAVVHDSPDLLHLFPMPEARMLEILNDYR